MTEAAPARRAPDWLFTRRGLAWLLAVLLVAWAPFPGEQRPAMLGLTLLGVWFGLARGETTARLPGIGLLRACLLLLGVPALLSLAGSQDPAGTVKIVAVLGLAYFAGIALLTGLGEGRDRPFGVVLGLVLGFWVLDGLAQWQFGQDLFGVPLVDNRVVGPFGDNLRMSVMLGVLMPVWLFPLAARRPLPAVLGYLACAGVIALSGARASLVFALLAGIGLFMRLPGWRGRAALLAGCLGVVAYAAWYSPALKQRLVDSDYAEILRTPAPPAETAGQFHYLPGLDTYLSGRVTIWNTALEMARAHPWVGVGAGAFDEAYPAYITRPSDPFQAANGRNPFHAHQMYISALAETGVIGLGALLACVFLVARWYRRIERSARARAQPYLYALGIAFFPLNSQHGIYIGWWFFTLLLLFCAMLAASGPPRQDA
jgi:O-antigen ligase